MGPFLGVDADDIGVAHDEQRPLPAAALEPRKNVRATGLEREDLDGDALGLEDVLQVFGCGQFVARRIGCVHADERLEVPERFLVELR